MLIFLLRIRTEKYGGSMVESTIEPSPLSFITNVIFKENSKSLIKSNYF